MGHDEIACSIRGIVSIKGRCGSFALKPACEYCKKNPSAEDGDIKCRKLQKFLDKGKCSAFRYDPVKHKLILNPVAVTPPPPEPSVTPEKDASAHNTVTQDEKTDEEQVQQADRFFTEDEKKLWAKPTLITDCETEGLIKVFEVSAGTYAKKETIRNRIWIHDIFDDNGIEYYIEMELKHQGKQFAEVQSIYVRPEDKENALFLIWTFSKADFVAPEYTPDVATQNMVDGIPQKQCQSCNEEIDFDYHTCPHCKAPV